MITPKDCPICEYHHSVYLFSTDEDKWYVQCINCQQLGKQGRTKEEAIRFWNNIDGSGVVVKV